VTTGGGRHHDTPTAARTPSGSARIGGTARPTC
jgi:hypothetical protein